MAEATNIQDILEHIVFTNTDGVFITGDQGVDSVEEIKILNDYMVENFFKVICRTGGTAVVGGADTGMKFSARAKDNLKIAIYDAKHQERVSQAINFGSILLVIICKLIKQRET